MGGDRNIWSHMFFFPDYPIVERELPIVYQKLIVIQNIVSLSNSTFYYINNSEIPGELSCENI